MVATLRRARRDAGLTRRRLSELSGVSGHRIAKIEQAAVIDPDLAVVAAIAEALELPLDDLLRRAGGASGNCGRVSTSANGSNDRIGG